MHPSSILKFLSLILSVIYTRTRHDLSCLSWNIVYRGVTGCFIYNNKEMMSTLFSGSLQFIKRVPSLVQRPYPL